MAEQQDSSRTRKFFDEEAGKYNSSFIWQAIPGYKEMQGAMSRSIRSIRDEMPQIEQLLVADLGIGTGNTSRLVLDILPKAKIVGYDLSEKMLEESEKNLRGSNIELICDDMINFKSDGEYDIVVSSMAIHHLKNEQKKVIFKNVYDSLKPKGAFVLSDIVRNDDPSLNKLFLKDWKDYMLNEGGPEFRNKILEDVKKGKREYFTVNQYLDNLKNVGFEVEPSFVYMISAVFHCKKNP